MGRRLGVFLATLFVCWAALAGMRRLYIAVASMPMERFMPPSSAGAPETVKPTLLPPEPQSPDFGYREEAEAMESRAAAGTAPPAAGDAPPSAKPAKTAGTAALPASEKAPRPQNAARPAPPKKESKEAAARPARSGARVRDLLEQARRKAGTLRRIGFKANETVMFGDGDAGSSAAQGPAERPKLHPSPGIREEGGASMESPAESPHAAPNSQPQRTMRSVSYGGSSAPTRPSVQRADEVPAVMAPDAQAEEGGGE